MSRLRIVFMGVTVLLIASGGVALASNMAYKVVAHLDFPDPNVYDISLPQVNNYPDLVSVFNDIDTNSPGCSMSNGGSVTAFDEDNLSCTWNQPFSCNRVLLPDEYIRVTVAAPGNCHGWVIVGANADGDPSLVKHGVRLKGPDPLKINSVKLKYNGTAITNCDVWREVNSIPAVPPNPPGVSNAAYVRIYRPGEEQTSCDCVDDPVTNPGGEGCEEPLPIFGGVRIGINGSDIRIWRQLQY